MKVVILSTVEIFQQIIMALHYALLLTKRII